MGQDTDTGTGGFGGPGGPSGPGGRPRRRGGRFGRFGIRPKRVVAPKEPLDYKNISYLATFIGPTGKILSRRRTGFSGQNQRKLTNAIKLARFMALLPYIGSSGEYRPRSNSGDYRPRSHSGEYRPRRD
ncbi:MAG: 30S ribosomal protein S18 [Planctomycetota bacterium]